MKTFNKQIKTIFISLACLFLYHVGYSQAVITNFSNITLNEGDPATLLAPNVTVGGGNFYSDNYIEFTYTGGGTADEILSLLRVATPVVTLNEVSIVGDNIYLGKGATAKQIGYVDGTLNGLAGNNLRMNFSSPLTNAQFTDPVVGGVIPGWTVNQGQILLNALAAYSQGNAVTISGTGPYTITGAGYSFITDVNYDPAVSSAYGFESVQRPSGALSTSVSVVADGAATGGKALYLQCGGSVVNDNGTPQKYGSRFGPEVWSEAFDAYAGDNLYLSYRAQDTQDNYEVYGFLVNTATNAHTILFYGRGGTQTWTEISGVIPADGNYKFRFVNGTYDKTGGFAVGSDMWIDNIRVVGQDVNDAVVQALARKVTYQNTSCLPVLNRTINFNARNTNGVVGTASATVTVIAGPAWVIGSISADQSICPNFLPAELTGVAPTGGRTPYTYQWQSSTDDITYTNIGGATSLNYQPPVLTTTTYYQCIQSEAGNCDTGTTNKVTITVSPPFFAGSISANQTLCYNTIPNELTGVAPTGGVLPYTYQWQSSSTGNRADFTNIPGASNLNYQPPALTRTTHYRLIQTSCISVFTNIVTITVYHQFVVGSISADQSISYNTAPNQLDGVAPTGGSIPYTYQWQSSTDNVTFTNIGAATSLNYQPPALTATTYYQLVQTSASGCGNFTTNKVTITVYPLLEIIDVIYNEIRCFGDHTGYIGVTATGGFGRYYYSKDLGVKWQRSPNFTNLPAGQYNIAVKDEIGCVKFYANNPVILEEHDEVYIHSVNYTDVTGCNGNTNGTISINAGGGSGFLEYSVDNEITWHVTNVISGLTSGNYNVWVKDYQYKQCRTEHQQIISLSEPPVIVINNVEMQEVGSIGATDGVISIDANGGTGILQYSVDDGVSWRESNVFNGLSEGVYFVKVKDQNDCIIEYENNPVVMVVNNIINQNIDQSVNIYPNPVRDQFVIKFNNFTEKVNVIIVDSKGTSIKEFSLYPVKQTFEKTVQTNDLNKGLYFVKIRTDGGYINVKKIIIL